MQQGRRPVGVGFFFSLGHSTVVVLLCVGLALSAAYVQTHLPQWKNVGTLVGTVVSTLFLYVIGVINLVVLWDITRAFKRAAQGEDAADIDGVLEQRGLLGRLFRPVLRLVSRSWQMYFVGFLFGLGFDTATEVGILTLSAHSGRAGMPLWVLLLLPALFTVGMCLVDTLDGILMLGAYGWAFVKPVRKLYYNLGITLLSVLVAFLVGTDELLQILAAHFSLKGQFWSLLDRLSFDNLGFVIVGTFAVGWGLSVLFYRWKGYETVSGEPSS
jgi:high-affinity nickel-transport protein